MGLLASREGRVRLPDVRHLLTMWHLLTFQVDGLPTLRLKPPAPNGLLMEELSLRPLMQSLNSTNLAALFTSGGCRVRSCLCECWVSNTSLLKPPLPVKLCQCSWSGECCCAAGTTAD
jgi:hypothetical protein